MDPVVTAGLGFGAALGGRGLDAICRLGGFALGLAATRGFAGSFLAGSEDSVGFGTWLGAVVWVGFDEATGC